MKTLWMVLLLVFITAACGKGSSPIPSKDEATAASKIVIEKEKVEREQSLSPEVKIRLKRDGKENYSWELTGTDVDQILKVNEKMAKQLGEKRK